MDGQAQATWQPERVGAFRAPTTPGRFSSLHLVIQPTIHLTRRRTVRALDSGQFAGNHGMAGANAPATGREFSWDCRARRVSPA